MVPIQESEKSEKSDAPEYRSTFGLRRLGSDLSKMDRRGC